MSKPTNKKLRLDQLLVDRGLCSNRSKAKALVLAGEVILGDHRADKAGQQVYPDAEVRLKTKPHDYVSRGALKLKKGLEAFPCDCKDLVALDVGASTGGFTEVWLRAGVRSVYAVDVGSGQLDWSLRSDPRVLSMEKMHIGKLPVGDLDPPPTLVSIDVSFIGLSKVLPMVKPHLPLPAIVYALVKPQFEAGREFVGKGGIVRDPLIHQQCVDRVQQTASSLGWDSIGVIESPIQGADGNVEFIAVFQTKKSEESK